MGEIGVKLPDIVSLLRSLPREQQIEIVKQLSCELEIPFEKREFLPHSIFTNKLSCLESISRYLHENIGLSFAEIGRKLGRSAVTIRTTYNNARDKSGSAKLDVSGVEFKIPTSLFSDRSIPVMGHIVVYLKDHYELKFRKIAELLCRDYKTVWTAYSKVIKKNDMTKNNQFNTKNRKR